MEFKFDGAVLHHEEIFDDEFVSEEVFNFTKPKWTFKDEIANVTIMVSALDISRELRKAFKSQMPIVAEVFRFAGMCELLAEPSRTRGQTSEMRNKTHNFQARSRARLDALWNP